jgi:DNA repair protein RecN (Recombination protein N)
MLEYLRIRNLALIEDVELELSPGLNVLTGETGAGKSFILRAVNFLTGDRLGADFVRPGREKAMVEALFVTPEGETMLRRELSAETGRSRIFLNDALGGLEAVTALKPGLFVHASQHARERLLSPAFQAGVVDGFVADKTLLAERGRLLSALRETAKERENLEARCRELAEKRDFLEFQQREIGAVAPKPGEEDELLARREAARGLEASRKAAEAALGVLHAQGQGLLDSLSELIRAVRTLAAAREEFAEDVERLGEVKSTFEELSSRLRREPRAAAEVDLEAVEARLWQLSQLKRKLGKSLAAILDLGREIEANLSFLDNANLDLSRLKRREEALASELAALLGALDAAREAAGGTLTKRLQSELKALGFSEHVRVVVDFVPAEVWPGILEHRARILWQPNPGQPAQALDRIASGGELSRFLLALTGLKGEDKAPTLIFDEVDAGIGGLTLSRVAERLQSLAARQQVICITHWPQLAARAERHFLVAKEVLNGETFTRCRRLDRAEIVAELSRMAGGGEQGENLARELLSAS